MEPPREAPPKQTGLTTLGIALFVVGLVSFATLHKGMGIALAVMGIVFLIIGWKTQPKSPED